MAIKQCVVCEGNFETKTSCKTCSEKCRLARRREINSRYVENHVEQVAERNRQWARSHREKVRELARKNYAKNIEKRREKSRINARKQRILHPDKIRQRHQKDYVKLRAKLLALELLLNTQPQPESPT